jgi:DNA-binding response OmpR family regulator
MQIESRIYIFVVDDEDIARTNLEYILKKEGYHVTTAVNGADALEKVMAGEFDLILVGYAIRSFFAHVHRHRQHGGENSGAASRPARNHSLPLR